MEQTTQYLYEYQNGKRVRNIGFMKIEKQMDKYLMRIYAKNVDDIQGILFQKENGEKYVGGWEAEMLPVEEPTTVTMPQQQPTVRDTPQDIQEQPAPPQMQALTDNLQTPHEHQESLLEQEEIDSYIPPRNITYEKIARQDISRFPRKEWRIANNSFLLHGYHNYHHLLYIEEDGKIWLGVPGVFHEKEEVAAKAFGFPEFRRLTDVDLELEENEKNTYEDFGYWCRQIPMS
ncbi:MAG: hypothetical protein IJE60_03675 [Tyzzerella sp.]|nr:hypothetical protein [Tyzzerella sp.]